MRPRFYLFILLIIVLTGCSGSRNWEAALLLSDISAGADSSWLKDFTPVPVRQTVSYTVAGRQYMGDIYTPADGALARLVMVPGAAEEGKDDPRLIEFATSLARVRFAVLVPDLPSLRKLKVNSGNIREIADGVNYLVSQDELAPQGHAGLVAFSYAAGPAIAAARQPELAEQVGFVLTIGGYYTLPAVLSFITTGHYLDDGVWKHQEPSPYGKWVFVISNLHHLDESADRDLFQSMVERKKADLAASIDDLAQRLGPQGQDLYRFITNNDRTKVQVLLERLPRGIQEEVERLDLSSQDLSQLKARLLLIHGFDDDIIPFTESVALAKAMPTEQVELYLIDGLVHVDAKPGLVGRWRMWQALAALLAERNRGTGRR